MGNRLLRPSASAAHQKYVDDLINSAEKNDWCRFQSFLLENPQYHQKSHRYLNNLTFNVIRHMIGDYDEEEEEERRAWFPCDPDESPHRTPPPDAVNDFLGTCVVNNFDRVKFLVDACKLAAPLWVISEHLESINPNVTWPSLDDSCRGCPLKCSLQIEEYSIDPDVVKALVGAFPDLLSERDDDGKLPLHYLCQNDSAPLELLSLFLEEYPEGASEEDDEVHLPLQLLWNTREDSVSNEYDTYWQHEYARIRGDYAEYTAWEETARDLHESTKLLTRAMVTKLPPSAHGDSVDDSNVWYPIDALIGINCKLPAGFFHFLLAMQFDCVSDSRDRLGRYPIHVMAALEVTKCDEGIAQQYELMLEEGFWSETASRTPDRSGKLPLHISAGVNFQAEMEEAPSENANEDERGTDENDYEGSDAETGSLDEDSGDETSPNETDDVGSYPETEHGDEDSDDDAGTGPENADLGGGESISDDDIFFDLILGEYRKGAEQKDNVGRLPIHYAISDSQPHRMKALLYVYPASAIQPDPVTGFLPALLAAIKDCPLDMLYTLLRADPGRIVRGKIDENESNNLKRKVSLLEEKNHSLEQRIAKLQRLVPSAWNDYLSTLASRPTTSS